MSFFDRLEDAMKKQQEKDEAAYVFTENGAKLYATSGEKLVDFNFKISSYRSLTEDDIIADFSAIYEELPEYAVKMMFFAGDIREGMGERRLFRTCLKWLAENHTDVCLKIIGHISEYNRWDTLINLIDVPAVKQHVVTIIREQLEHDKTRMRAGESVSLLGKWMPSVNTSSKDTVRKAKILCKELGIKEPEYRRLLAALRAHIDVVEVKTSANKWGEINYEAVPSKANLKYRNAFLRNDEERRREFLSKLEKGEVKINSAVAYPHEIVNAYGINPQRLSLMKQDQTIEGMWKNLPDYIGDDGDSVLCVVDVSGSMTWENLGGFYPLTVATALGIYFSERLRGAFKDKFLTFSAEPSVVDLSDCKSLREKIQTTLSSGVGYNTDVEAVFDLILDTAVKNNLQQSEMPSSVMILSDMEFDEADSSAAKSSSLFDSIGEKYKAHGYKLPRLVFWNIASRTNGVPLRVNDNGVALLSGFSPAIADMVIKGEPGETPIENLLKKLDSDRYKPITIE